MVAEVIVCLSSKHVTLSLNSSATKKNKSDDDTEVSKPVAFVLGWDELLLEEG
jgi:hypothetical protein